MRRNGMALVTRPLRLCILLMTATLVFASIEALTDASPFIERTSIAVTVVNLVSCASVLIMRRRPWIVMGSSLLSLFGTFAFVASSPMAYFLVAVGCVSVANWGRFASFTVPLVGVVSAVALVTSPTLISTGVGFDPASVLYTTALPVLLAALAVAVGFAARQQQQVMAQLRSQHDELEELQRRETDAAVASERTRISRELHDVVAHHVSALLIEAQAGQRIADRGGTPDAARWQAVTDVARETLQSMRRMVRLLRAVDEAAAGQSRDPQPRITDLDELILAMERAGLEVQLDRAPGLDALPSDLQLGVYRIVQEALTNVLRHASAARATVRVGVERGFITAEIRDDGLVESDFRLGNGLLGMRERVASLGGNLDLRVEPGAGLRISARLPVDSPLSPRVP